MSSKVRVWSFLGRSAAGSADEAGTTDGRELFEEP
jgi:hypothetical protein